MALERLYLTGQRLSAMLNIKFSSRPLPWIGRESPKYPGLRFFNVVGKTQFFAVPGPPLEWGLQLECGLQLRGYRLRLRESRGS